MTLRNRSGRLRARRVAVARLGEGEREAMWELYARYYAQASRATFDRDLLRKQHVIQLRDRGDGSLQGFTTIEVYDQVIASRRCVAVYSGDTVIEKGYWGQRALQRAFFTFLMRQKARHPTRPVYWFLISKGYKTYLLLARNVPNHHPRHDRPTPAWEQAVLHALAESKFGEAYDRAAGVVRYRQPEAVLKPNIAPIEPALLEQPDIRFFVERNPGHARGDELCCLGRVDATLLVHFLRRQLVRRRPTDRGRDASLESTG